MRIPVSRCIAALCMVGALLVAGCQSMQDMLANAPKPKAHVIGSSIRGLSLEHIVLLFDVEIENPYPAALPLASLGYSLSSGGKKFLDGSVKPNGTIPARGKQVLQVPATVQFSSLASVLKGVKPGSILPYTADFSIGVDAPAIGHVDVPFSKSGELPVPAVPRVELSSLDVGKLGLDQISATAKLKIHNNNQFALDMTKLGVSFALAGIEVGSSRIAQPVNLPADKDAVVEIPLSMSPRAVGLSLMNLLRAREIAYQVSGSLDTNSRFGPISIPFSHIGNTAVTK